MSKKTNGTFFKHVQKVNLVQKCCLKIGKVFEHVQKECYVKEPYLNMFKKFAYFLGTFFELR